MCVCVFWKDLQMPVMAPLRSLSARMFIGAELSTHTISFKESPQHECKALQESRRMSSSTLHTNHMCDRIHSPDNCSQTRTKI